MTERLIPFDLEAAKADPSRVRHADGTAAHETLFGSEGAVICRWSSNLLLTGGRYTKRTAFSASPPPFPSSESSRRSRSHK